jgi:hypothetical protein
MAIKQGGILTQALLELEGSHVRIFISWSGDRSKHVALALREWLPLVLHYAEPWLSDKDIEAGNRWATDVGKELESSNFGILVLTKENLLAPWILFEAGALSKAFSVAAVCPLLVDVDFKDLTGPLSQFQAKKIDKVSVSEMIEAINRRAKVQVPGNRLNHLIDSLWPRCQDELAKLPPSKSPEPNTRSESDVLEDLVMSIRRLERRIDHVVHRPRMTDHTVELEVEGKFPDLEDGANVIYFTPSKDLVEEVANIAGADLDEFGDAWNLRDKRTGNFLEREDGPRYANLSRHRRQRLILTTIPF